MGDHRGVANTRGNQTVRDLVLSMAVIGVVVAVIYIFIPHSEGDPVKSVSYTVELGQARRDAPFAVAAPVGLDKQWRATSVMYDASDTKAVAWHLGFVDPENEYAAVEQSNANAVAFIKEKTYSAVRSGSRTVDGFTWARYKGDKYDALVREEGGVTTMVTGTASFDQLAKLAAALQERGGQ
ncbi:DUF4245 domain-containing protein [Actinacidiphila soli]|uniref:DUF4245 domain-containing protein n=1 Tax=Actinacidiphila soli TaxID=2487275 RepID=UPI000FCB17F5|nr:DUF4245 domain-containing protein [Actinacidiphila soli]